MKQPLEIRFIGMPSSEAVESAARDKALRLDRFCPSIMTCRVAIEHKQKHQHQGQPFAVRVDVTLPGHELTVNRVEHEDVYVALREAFDDMRRQVEDAVRLLRGQEKQHPTALHGEVVRFDAEGKFGFIRTADGDEYWFSAENVVNEPFESMPVGTQVQFIPEVAAEGRQAKRVSVGRHSFG